MYVLNICVSFSNFNAFLSNCDLEDVLGEFAEKMNIC